MKNRKYHSVGTVLKYHTIGTVLKYHTVGRVPKYHTVGTVLKYHTVGTVLKYHTVGTVSKSKKNHRNVGKIDTPSKHIYEWPTSWLNTGTWLVKYISHLRHFSPKICHA